MLRTTKMEKLWLVLFVLSFAVVGMAIKADSQTVPTWKWNDVAAGKHTFYATVPRDQTAAGPGICQIQAKADTVRASFYYYTGSVWTAMNGNVAYGDTNFIIPPGEKAVFRFSYPKPDVLITTGGNASVWAE